MRRNNNCISFFAFDVSFYSLERFVAYHMLHAAGVGSGGIFIDTKADKHCSQNRTLFCDVLRCCVAVDPRVGQVAAGYSGV